MRQGLLKLKRLIKRIFKVKEDFDPKDAYRRSRVLIKYGMGLVAVVLITFLYPQSDLFGPLDVPRQGEIAPENIIAENSFDIYKDQAQLEEENRLLITSTPLYIIYNEETARSGITGIHTLLGGLDSAKGAAKESSIDKAVANDQNSPADKLVTQLQVSYPFISNQWLRRLVNYDSLGKGIRILDTILTDDIYYYGVIDNIASLPPPGFNSIILRKPKRDLFLIRSQLIDLPTAYNTLLDRLNEAPDLSDSEVELLYEIGRHFILANNMYDDSLTQAARDSSLVNVSRVESHISSGDLLIRRGVLVDAGQERILNAYAIEMQNLAAARGWFQAIMPLLGRMVLIGGIIILIYLFLLYFRPDVYWSNNKLLALLLIIGLELALVSFIEAQLAPSIYLYPIAILSILVTVLFDARLGVVITLLVAILLGILHRFNFSLTLVTAMAGMVACFSAGEVRRRSEFYRIILYLSVSYVIIAFVVESLKLSPTGDVLTYCGYGLASAFIAPILTIGILPLFESLFSFSTNITLLELADLNQPLLKRLAMEAPGTYHHSIIVGNLAEAAAKKIGANSLLARVGSYYHDIGKMEIPEYYVENQLGIKSKHEGLNPTMSALVLSSHVKKGRLIGEDAGLPDAVLGFVEEHHGTTLMKYFYNKALEMELPMEDDLEFRYPGPKPQSRETAIVMLADSTEAASRTLDKPTSARINNLIQKLINEKFASGELTECDLTLKDLNDIKLAFVSILIGVFHQRIPYPKREEEEPI